MVIGDEAEIARRKKDADLNSKLRVRRRPECDVCAVCYSIEIRGGKTSAGPSRRPCGHEGISGTLNPLTDELLVTGHAHVNAGTADGENWPGVSVLGTPATGHPGRKRSREESSLSDIEVADELSAHFAARKAQFSASLRSKREAQGLVQSSSSLGDSSSDYTDLAGLRSSSINQDHEESDAETEATELSSRAESMTSIGEDEAGVRSDLMEDYEESDTDYDGSSSDSSYWDSSEDEQPASMNTRRNRRAFSVHVLSSDKTEDEIVQVARKKYQLRERGAGILPSSGSYNEESSPEPGRRIAGGGRPGENRRKNQTIKTRKHFCPCHNIDISVALLRAAGRYEHARRVAKSGKTPRMTSKMLGILYPKAERICKVELYLHRINTLDDQSVHEAATYAFDLRGWPRRAGGYEAAFNKMARKEDIDRVQDLMNGLKKSHADRAKVVDLTGE